MNPNALRTRETSEWLAKADEDLAAANLLANAGLDQNALYHCQQAV